MPFSIYSSEDTIDPTTNPAYNTVDVHMNNEIIPSERTLHSDGYVKFLCSHGFCNNNYFHSSNITSQQNAAYHAVVGQGSNHIGIGKIFTGIIIIFSIIQQVHPMMYLLMRRIIIIDNEHFIKICLHVLPLKFYTM